MNGPSRKLEVVSGFFSHDSHFNTPLEHAIRDGKWEVPKGSSFTRWETLIEILNRDSLVGTLTHLTRINTRTKGEKDRVSIDAKEINGSQYFFRCLAHTPDSKSCGLVKNLAQYARVTSVSRLPNLEPFINHLLNEDYPPIVDTRDEAHKHFLLVNGRPRGWVDGPTFVTRVRSERRRGWLDYDLSVSFVAPVVRINSSAGRLVAPFLVVAKDGRLEFDVKNMRRRRGLTFLDLLQEGVVEFLDAAEMIEAVVSESTVFLGERAIARKKWLTGNGDPVGENVYTHCALDPLGLFGFAAGLSPRPDMMQGPRFVFQCAMATQTIGQAAPGSIRFDNKRKMLVSGNLPTFFTDISNTVGIEDLPATDTMIIMIAPYEGENQEDSIVLNEATVERGKFFQLVYTTYEVQETGGHVGQIRIVPLDVESLPLDKRKHMHALGPDGIARLNTEVKEDDVLVSAIRYNTTDVSSANYADYHSQIVGALQKRRMVVENELVLRCKLAFDQLWGSIHTILSVQGDLST